ncbi:aldehyde dehydrogenase family protein [Marinomonas sp. 15G1-11]|uniref:Aldehyde dehydrogenase family protein n=1 Tax=Marinomonas phaeophyticola TaxID=3004091 RepID=A0ABT4JPU0_9GAMM|nr:aldehyde dehydrogenase family protein [Marinomonas sp. 15G1-11]MCZ2720396.1 aldehyde dehydrogenase family protein [Marinomonas sp. 15G1-11]
MKKLYIGGELRTSKNSFKVINPANDEVVGEIAWGDESDACSALKSADEALPYWSSMPVEERVAWMHKLRDALINKEEYLIECIHLEMGKAWHSAKEDFSMLLDSLNFYSEAIYQYQPKHFDDKDSTFRHTMTYESVGVVVAYLAWNFPLLNLAYKIGPAMASGCPIVIKPSFKAPLSTYAFGEICAEIGLPKGVINIVCGDDAIIGDTLSRSVIPGMITLIGSTQTGLHVMKTGSTSIKRYSMELGGNAPAIVCSDADLDLAADIICGVKFANAGQICVTPNRVFVEASIHDSFCQKLVGRAERVKVGFDRNAPVDMGPLIDKSAWERVDANVKKAISEGGILLTGGGYPKGIERGSFYAPTVFSHIEDHMTIAREEMFGPVISVLSFTSEEDVIKRANATEAGLSSFIFTNDDKKAEKFANALQFGEVQVNGIKYGIDLMHGGLKQSGIGCDCSELALEDYLTPKRISKSIR